MSYEELLVNVKNKLRGLEMITVNNVQQRYHVLQGDARKVVQQLQDEGLVSKAWSIKLGGYPVLKEKV